MAIVSADVNVLKKHAPRSGGSCLDSHLSEIEHLLRDGVSKVEIAKRFNVSKQTLHRFLNLRCLSSTLASRLKSAEQAIVDLFRNGLSIREIARRLRFSPTAISAKLNELKLNRRRSEVARSTILTRHGTQIAQMFASGLSYTAIAKYLGIHAQTVQRCIQSLGLVRSSRGHYSSAVVGREDMLLKMHSADIPTKTIAQVFGCTPQVIRYHLRRFGRKMDTHGRPL
ncbi:MAG: helix-turn-helix domain-containing protein [Alphaproteobacteria bacterium]|nr:helix-turn-helix domain-containing protein [Alphaproteobacteria bacterium]